MTRMLNSLAELERALIGDTLKVLVAAEMAMGHAAKIVQHDAQDRIGEYQQATGPFQDWAPLADSTEEQKARLGFPADSPLLRTGALRDSIVTEHNALEAIVGSKMEIAAYQEFGTERIPPRPFLGPAAFDKRKQIHGLIGAAVVGALVGATPVHPSLGYDMEVK